MRCGRSVALRCVALGRPRETGWRGRDGGGGGGGGGRTASISPGPSVQLGLPQDSLGRPHVTGARPSRHPSIPSRGLAWARPGRLKPHGKAGTSTKNSHRVARLQPCGEASQLELYFGGHCNLGLHKVSPLSACRLTPGSCSRRHLARPGINYPSRRVAGNCILTATCRNLGTRRRAAHPVMAVQLALWRPAPAVFHDPGLLLVARPAAVPPSLR